MTHCNQVRQMFFITHSSVVVLSVVSPTQLSVVFCVFASTFIYMPHATLVNS